MMNKIKTNIKFNKKGNGQLYGFVTKTSTGSWRGCRETPELKKKIVILDEALSVNRKDNILYHCTLIPMRGEGGFIAISAEPIKFRAKLETIIDEDEGVYQLKVRFGNCTLAYDPSSKDANKNCIQTIYTLIQERDDLETPIEVAGDFYDNACLVYSLYKRARQSQNKSK